MLRNHDLVFMKHFSQVIVFLVVVTAGLILFAIYLHGTRATEPDLAAEANTVARLRPAGAVYAGETGAAAMAAAAEEARKAAAGQVAFGGSLDGSVIFGGLCGACHTTGAGGAPKMEKAAWAARAEQGAETLMKHAREGFTGTGGIMPARGGNPGLTDEQIDATVKWMLDNLK